MKFSSPVIQDSFSKYFKMATTRCISLGKAMSSLIINIFKGTEYLEGKPHLESPENLVGTSPYFAAVMEEIDSLFLSLQGLKPPSRITKI